MSIIIENKYHAKPWVRPWMFYVMYVPYLVVKDIATIRDRILMDMDDVLVEWKFGGDE